MLDIRGIVKTFHPGTENEVRALQGVDLRVEDGSFVVVIGTNGSGKSTLQNAVSGSVVVDEGTILLAGRDITRWPEHRRAALIGRVFQNPFSGTAPGMSVGENLALAERRGLRRTLRRNASLRSRVAAVRGAWTVPAEVVLSLPAALRAAQPAFDATGGIHASALCDRDGRVRDVAEDVGRHNALDKIVGRALLEGRLPLDDALLVVSGRSSYELVQKALLAGVPLVAGVSAPSSLAVDLAQASGITLCGFVRGTSMNVYTHRQRITGL